ncbi:hypothetical protein Tco_0442100 [Tanacetum coccineum]
MAIARYTILSGGEHAWCGGEGYGEATSSNDIDIDFFKDEAAGWESIAETRNLEEFELEASKEVRKNWIEKDRCKSDMLKQQSRVKWIHDGSYRKKVGNGYDVRVAKTSQEVLQSLGSVFNHCSVVYARLRSCYHSLGE